MMYVDKPDNNLNPSKSNGKTVNLDHSIDFLRIIWDYSSVKDVDCFSIVVIGEDVKYKHFCLSEYQDYNRLFNSIRRYLSKVGSDKHVYFQVLPLSKKPSRGRGSEKDVKIGKWLWVDLDYKEVVDKPEFKGCKDLEDYALECYYTESGKWIHVKRPPLNQVLNEVKNKLGLEPLLVVDSGAGYHLYFRLAHEVDATTLKKVESWLVDKLGGDPQSKDLARILRLPGSVNPRVNREVKVIYQNPQDVDPKILVEEIEREKKEPQERETPKNKDLRELTDTEILRIVDLLKDAYKPGYRQFLILYLSGWLAKARVSPLSATKLVKHLYETTGDTDPLKTRLSAIIYSYKKAGVNIDEYSREIEDLAGVKPYGLEREIREDSVKGRTGLQEILESTLGEERALAVIHELSEILQTLSPFRDSIVELLDYEKQIYAVANLRKLVIARAKRENNVLIYKERVSVVAPTRVIVYSNPIGGLTKYEITFEGYTLQKPLVVGPATIDEISDRIMIEGLVYHRKLIHDTLSAIIQAFIRKGKAEVRTEIESPGFYLVGNKLVSVKYEVGKVDVEKLREALELLNELAEVWFKHIQDKFSSIVKWGATAPFGYILKQKGKWIPWLYLYGDSATGKTTLGKIVLRIWGLDSRYEKTGATIDTIPRLGYVLSMSTFPVLINEPGSALSKEDVVEAIKNAVDSVVVRGKYVKGAYTEIPALAPLIFTSNRFLPRDDALLRRFKVITFSYGEKIPLEKQKEFKEKVEPRLSILSEIGKCISKIVIDTQVSELDGKILLEKCYEISGLEKPQWLGLEYTETQDLSETILEEFVERFKKYVNDSFSRYISRVVEIDRESEITRFETPDSIDLERKLRILTEKNLLSGVRLLKEGKIGITSTLLREIGLEGRITLKSLSEMLRWDYRSIRIGDKVTMGIVTEIQKIIELLSPPDL
ncbi:MAG: hypothetical protein QXQ84_09145 [Nitrososphaerota archaeon]